MQPHNRTYAIYTDLLGFLKTEQKEILFFYDVSPLRASQASSSDWPSLLVMDYVSHSAIIYHYCLPTIA